MRIGIDIGGSHIACGLIEKGEIIAKREKDFEKEDRKSIEKVIEKTIIDFTEEILKERNLKVSEIEKIGLAVPGTTKNGVIVKAENLGIVNFKILEILSKHFDCKNIKLNNDAKCAGICEKEFGSLKNYDDCVFICLGTGIGGAVFLEGELLKPKRYSGFELGHMMIDKNGRKCNCGAYGCFETYASMKSLKDRIAIKKNNYNLSGKEIYQIIKDDRELEEILEEFIQDLNIGLSNIINIFEPEAICIGGGFIHYKDLLLDRLINKMYETKLTFNNDFPIILTAKMRK
ncbi:MAG: ROK family protein [Clostridia bacterium]|jgi:glucokinase|nr:ROK family protein [Clostridia bacterium]